MLGWDQGAVVPFKAKCTADINGGKAVASRLHDPQIVTVHAVSGNQPLPRTSFHAAHFSEHPRLNL